MTATVSTRTTAAWGVGVLGLALAAGGAAHGQGMPDRKEIERRVREAFPRVMEASPEETVEVAGVCKLTYKKVPTDPKKIAETVGQSAAGGALPPGVDVGALMGGFQAQITEMLNEFLQDVGTLEALQTIKVKGKTVIPPGKHKVGLLVAGDRPVALRVFDEKDDAPLKKKPVDIPLKAKGQPPAEELKIELKEPKKKKEGEAKFEVWVHFMQALAKSKAVEGMGDGDEGGDEDE